MDHAIADLKNRLQGAIEMYQGYLPREQIEPEIKAYVKSINILEEYYYGEKKTDLEVILAFFE